MVETRTLVHTTEVKVRFNEVDALGIVWHGHYVKYFEDGREAFGEKYDLGYMEVYKYGFSTPIVNINIDFKKTVAYGDLLIVETTYIFTSAAKINFSYIIFKKSTQEIVAKGATTQVFLTVSKELYITNPPFYKEWKAKYFKA